MQDGWSYVEGTGEFLKKKMKCLDKIPEGTTLVTADVVGLFTNILHDLRLQSLGKMLNETCICEVPTEEIISIA